MQDLYYKYGKDVIPERSFKITPRAKKGMPKRLQKYGKMVHVSKPSGIYIQLFGEEEAAKMVGAKGTLCKKCRK